MAEACLFMVTERKLFWINIRELMALGEEEVVDWKRIPPPLPFSYVAIPDPNRTYDVHHFVFDSKVYVAKGGLDDPYAFKYDDDMPICKIYQFDMDKKEFTGSGADSIDPPPSPCAPCFMGNVSGEVYFFVHDKLRGPELEGLWVLSSPGQWKYLSPPPPLQSWEFRGNYCHCFVFQDKFFLGLKSIQAEPFLHSFDPRTASWTRTDDEIMLSHSSHIGFGDICFPSSLTMSLPVLSDCSVALSWSLIDAPSDLEGSFEVEVMIQALLLNKQNGAVLLHQSLDECLKGIRPTTFALGCTFFRLADLGNGTVCALLYGHTPDHGIVKRPILCVSVFTLTVAEDDIVDIGAGKEQNFLSVRVHVKRVFSMKDHKYLSMLDPFVFSPEKDLPH